MKMTNAQMTDALDVLSRAEETGKLGYAIARNRRKLADAAKEYTDIRDKLLTEYGEPLDDGKVLIPTEKVAAFQAGLDDYAGIEHEVDIMTVALDVFTGGGLTSQQMFALDWMVSDDG
ncbi:MAG: hypothetical protein LUC89_05825 [Oscillospiraceae bacterium]|nr:hypothetical protein [Oscillospiraceae bacterium]